MCAQVRVFDVTERLRGAAQARERVLDLVRDIGGEVFDRVDPVAQGIGHVGDCAGEHPDLVAPFWQAGHLHLALATEPHALRGLGEGLQGRDDRPREEEREQDRCQQREEHPGSERGSGSANRFGNIDGVAGGQQRQALQPDRRRRGDHRGTVGRLAQFDLRNAQFAGALQFGPRVGLVRFRFDVARHRLRADDRVDDLIEEAGETQFERIVAGIVEGEGRFAQLETVGHQLALGIEQAQPHVLFLADLEQQGILPLARGPRERFGGDLGFDAGQLVALVEQLRAIGIEVDDPAAQQQQGEDVDREDAGGEGKARENADTLQRERDAPHAAGLSHR